MRLLPTTPLRLPGLSTYIPRADDPAIFWFNGERDDIIREIKDRVFEEHSDKRDKLEFALNEVAWHESQRLARQRDEEAREFLPYWNGILRRVGRMTDDEKKRNLRGILERMTVDIAGNFDPRVYRFAENMIPRLLTGIMSPAALPREFIRPHSKLAQILHTAGPIEHLQRLAKTGTLVFVPTHSSNLDSVVLGYALQQTGLPPVVYGAGKNLFTNPIISFFMHNLGAYRVDRRIKAGIYKDVLKTYSTVMIERGYHSLFFPGGTRSRSGMLEHKLKLGLAGTAVEAFARNQIRGVDRRIYFVPVTINYALVLEAETLIEDFLKEQGQARYIIDDDEFSSLERWVAFLRKLTTMESPCVLRFGEPVDPFGNDVDDEGHSLAPHGGRIDPVSYIKRRGEPELDPARERAYTQELGEVLVDRFRRETVLLSTQIVAHALYRRVVRAAPKADDIVRCRQRGSVAVPKEELIRELGDLRDRLAALEEKGRVRMSRLIRNETPEYALSHALEAFRGYHSKEAARDLGAEVILEEPSLLLYYQNRVVPWAVDVADEANLQAAREIRRTGSAR